MGEGGERKLQKEVGLGNQRSVSPQEHRESWSVQSCVSASGRESEAAVARLSQRERKIWLLNWRNQGKTRTHEEQLELTKTN